MSTASHSSGGDRSPSRCPACRASVPAGAPFCPSCGKAVDTDPLCGIVIDSRYRVLRRLGAGAMGSVYEVLHERLGKHFAMKVIQRWVSGDEQFLARFRREAASLSKLSHPHCVEVIDFGESDGRLYMVMELVAGESLDQWVEAAPLAPAEAVALCSQLLSALEHVHEGGVIHRDVKPSNVVVTRGPGGEPHAKLVDFGVAKTRQQTTQLTQTGVVVGTPEYMAPEQGKGRQVDARADLYAVGVLLWRLLTGRRLFAEDDSVALLITKLTEDPPKLGEVVAGSPPRGLEELVDQALAREPDHRFASARAFREALERLDLANVGPLLLAAAAGPSLSSRGDAAAAADADASSAATSVDGVAASARGAGGAPVVSSPSWGDRLRALPSTSDGRLAIASATAALAVVLLGGWLVARGFGGPESAASTARVEGSSGVDSPGLAESSAAGEAARSAIRGSIEAKAPGRHRSRQPGVAPSAGIRPLAGATRRAATAGGLAGQRGGQPGEPEPGLRPGDPEAPPRQPAPPPKLAPDEDPRAPEGRSSPPEAAGAPPQPDRRVQPLAPAPERPRRTAEPDRGQSDRDRQPPGGDLRPPDPTPEHRRESAQHRRKADRNRHRSDKHRHKSDKHRHKPDKHRHKSDKHRHKLDKRRHKPDKDRREIDKRWAKVQKKLRQGKLAEAAEQLAKILDDDPRHVRARRLLQRIRRQLRGHPGDDEDEG